MKKQTFIKPGDTFGRLTAVKYLHTGKHYRRYFLFKCECGKEKTLQAGSVTSGNTRSCGCLSVESKKAKILPNNKGVINQIILGYKRHAARRGFAWKLKFEDVDMIVRKRCHYCGSDLSNIKVTKNCREGFKYNGIDRVNSSMGYTLVNVVPCCAICNKAKMDMTTDKFLDWVKRVHAYSFK